MSVPALAQRDVLRITHVLHALAPQSGGPSVTVPALCEGLGRLGHQVQLLVTDHGGIVSRPPQKFALHTYPAMCVGGRAGLSLSMHRALMREARAANVLHSHGLWLWTNFDAHHAATKARVAHILSPRGMLEPYALQRKEKLKRLLWSLGQGEGVRKAHCIHVTSESEYASIRGLGLGNPIAVVPNGVVIPSPTLRTEAPTKRLLFLGRLDHVKGVDLLVRAWAQLAPVFPAWQLDLVGPDTSPFATKMRALATELGASRIAFRGAAYDGARDAHLAAADLFVLPTRSENFGMAIAEALAAGVPVVCSKGAPWPGIATERCGIWLDIGVEPLVAALRQAMRMPHEERIAMGARGRAWMMRDFSWDAQARKMVAVYEWLTKRDTKPIDVRLD